MNKKILLAAFNARYTHSNPAVYAVRTSLIDFNIDVEILEFTIHDDLFTILEKMALAQPDIIGLSVYIWNTLHIQLLLPEIQKVIPNVKIILGGPEVSYNAEDWLSRLPMIDYIICGAGETALRKLAETDFIYPDKILNVPNPVFSKLPFPYLPSDKEYLKHKYVYYEASRGCPFHCSYCLSSREDQVLQFRDLESIKSELKQLWEFEPFIIKFIDRSFNVNQAFAREIWQFLIDESPDILYHFEIHPLYLEEEDFNVLKNVPRGRFQFEIGIQSIHMETNRKIGRSGEWDKIRPKLEKLREFKQIHQHYDAIVGLPTETKKKLGETVSELLTLKPDHLQLGFLKILPGTVMAEKTTEYGMQYQSNPPYRVFSTRWMTFSDIQSCENVEVVLDNYINSGHFPNLADECFELSVGNGFCRMEEFAEHILNSGFDIRTRDWLKKAKLLQAFYKLDEQHRGTLFKTLSAISSDELDEQHRGTLFKTLSAKSSAELDEQHRGTLFKTLSAISSAELDELLLWDWSIFPANLPYPDFLPIHLLNEAKQESLSYFKQLAPDHPFWKENDIQLDDTRRAHFFKATMPNTREKCLQMKGYAMILKRQGNVKIVFYDL